MNNSMNTRSTTVYKYPLWFPLFFALMSGLFLAVSCLILRGIVNIIVEEWNAFSFTRTNFDLPYIVAGVFFLLAVTCIVFFACLFFALLAFVAFPEISIAEQGFRVRSGFGLFKSPWLSWTSIRDTSYGMGHRLLFLGIDGLSWPYKISGLFFLGAKGGILVSQSINKSAQLFKKIEAERPDLFRQ